MFCYIITSMDWAEFQIACRILLCQRHYLVQLIAFSLDTLVYWHKGRNQITFGNRSTVKRLMHTLR